MRLFLFFLIILSIHIVTHAPNPILADDNHPPETAGSETDPLLLTATLKYNETSKDSNWHQYTVKIDKDNILLSKEFGGFNAPDNEQITKKMTTDIANKIWAFIKTNGLDNQIHEEQPTDGLGVAGYLHLEIKSRTQSIIHISGRTQMFGNTANAGNASGTNIININYINKANFFFNYLWRL
ncbi:MAG: hypothetical protein KJ630_21430 [Proteobacteria bacterium]|nr:hypothetical protein [Pseudomonadota bacterium]